MAKPKHNYDSSDFYKLIEQLAMNGYTDEEIANELNLSADVFGSMKNGNYQGWNDEENKRRGSEIYRVLAHGRTKIIALLRGAYIKGAFGGKKTKSKIVKYVQDKCECMGADKKCPYCGGTGWVTLTDKAVIQESETELPPNMQAISTLLYHHDPEWRKVERKLDEEAIDIPTDIKHGVDIGKWIEREVGND
ncbi:hypothetical protein [Bacteroides heparinolyticus]|uniref:hypothetical protein n=1 Tax=Prevotella heparinolytica TaxID=28113 RepID=UPI0023F0B62E|nr:hypothetical protein [Bacteroides heparinolyticus]